MVVRNQCPADVAQLLQSNSQPEICIAVTWVAGDGPLQCRDCIGYAADLKAGEAEIVMDDRVGWLEQCRIAQRRDRVAWPSSPEKLSG